MNVYTVCTDKTRWTRNWAILRAVKATLPRRKRDNFLASIEYVPCLRYLCFFYFFNLDSKRLLVDRNLTHNPPLPLNKTPEVDDMHARINLAANFMTPELALALYKSHSKN